ncbi:hypothetical protein [Campylobacter sp. 19-13652]|nr:hypothetical protein [Campylobacter sp. 19-13652]BCX79249.1 hypothetical protein LBC_07110 [Campylobacter sp. 19-13652]
MTQADINALASKMLECRENTHSKDEAQQILKKLSKAFLEGLQS